jgi:hypothetical protein
MSVPVLSRSLPSQYPIGLSVDPRFVGTGQFALTLHLRGTRLCISGVRGIRHRIFALLWQPEIAFRLSLKQVVKTSKHSGRIHLPWSRNVEE